MSTATLSAQWEWGNGFGGQVGISCAFGTHKNRIGVIAKAYYAGKGFQVNTQVGFWYYGTQVGSNKSTWEMQARLGALGAWGKTDSIVNPFVHELGNQTGRRFTAGYSYIWYWNTMKTSQGSGAIGFQWGPVTYILENDFLGFAFGDKYRTGAMGLYYRHRNTQFGIRNITWTGDPYAPDMPKMITGTDFPARYGYKDMSQAPFGDCSAGIVSVFVEHQFLTGKYIDASIGIDAEQIRNVVQNKWIHDSPILPLNWGKVGNPHIPMVCDDGSPYMYEEGQKIRPARFFMQFGYNGNGFY
jgi:hypothetical protein